MTAYERAGTIDTRAYAVDEVVRPYIKLMDDSDLIACYNEFATQNGDYRYSDDYARFNAYGNIDSFDDYKIRREIEHDDDFLGWMYANAYEDENQNERIKYALEMVKAGY